MSGSLVLAFAVLLMMGVLISERAHRTVLSTAVLFLLGGFVLGGGVLGVLQVGPDDPIVGGLAELALFSVLFTDGMRVGLSDLRRAWRLPGRALLLGLPLTLLLTAVPGPLHRRAPMVGIIPDRCRPRSYRPPFCSCDRREGRSPSAAASPAER